MNGLHPPSEALAGASESVLARVTALYAGAGPGSLGLKHIADDLGLQREVRKPRKKIRWAATFRIASSTDKQPSMCQQLDCMLLALGGLLGCHFQRHSRDACQPAAPALGACLDMLQLQMPAVPHSWSPKGLVLTPCSVMIVGNHSAGKSSFINWYIGERVVKTGVAIETRGFILCTSGRCVWAHCRPAPRVSAGVQRSTAGRRTASRRTAGRRTAGRHTAGWHSAQDTRQAGFMVVVSAVPKYQQSISQQCVFLRVPAVCGCVCCCVVCAAGSVRRWLVMPPSVTLTTWRALTPLRVCPPTCSQRSLPARSAALQQSTLWTRPAWWTVT